jgi:hypothetical protein
VHIFRLWQTFLDNVNPLSKVIHAPTVQYQILEATGNLTNISKGVESLMFAIYAAAVNSVDDTECESILGESKSRVLPRYFMATQHALIRAGFLYSSDLVVLQAFTLFLVSNLPSFALSPSSFYYVGIFLYYRETEIYLDYDRY